MSLHLQDITVVFFLWKVTVLQGYCISHRFNSMQDFYRLKWSDWGVVVLEPMIRNSHSLLKTVLRRSLLLHARILSKFRWYGKTIGPSPLVVRLQRCCHPLKVLAVSSLYTTSPSRWLLSYFVRSSLAYCCCSCNLPKLCEKRWSLSMHITDLSFQFGAYSNSWLPGDAYSIMCVTFFGSCSLVGSRKCVCFWPGRCNFKPRHQAYQENE